MKAIWSIILFGAIVALGVFCLSPIPRGIFEGYFKTKSEQALRDAGVSDPKVEMNHLHVVAEIEEGADITKATEALDSIYGVYIEGVSHKKQSSELPLAKQGLTPENPSTDPAKPDKPEPSAPPELILTNQPAQFTIEWSDASHVKLSGTLSHEIHLADIRKAILSQQKDASINSTNVRFSKNVQKPLYLEETLTLIPYLTKLSHGQRKLSYKDPHKKQAGSLEIQATTISAEHKDMLLRKLKAVESDAMEISHMLSFPSSFTITERPKDKKVVIIGTVPSVVDRSMLESVVQIEDGYSPDLTGVIIDPQSKLKALDEATAKTIRKHLLFAEPAELTFSNGSITGFRGHTQHQDYINELKNAFGEQPNIKIDLQYHEPPKLTEEQKAQLAQEAKKRATARLKAKLKDFKIYFESGKSTVSPEYQTLLENTANIIKESKDQSSTITIGGYADKSGDLTMNRRLSLKRAQEVQKKLTALGVPKTRTTVEFFGADEDTPSKVESRRVELRIN